MANQDLTSAGTPAFASITVGSKTIVEGDIVKNKYDATIAPTVNNDTSEGYAPGSVWVNTTDDIVSICSDNTDGAAVWNNLGGSVELYGGEYTAVASSTTNLDSTPLNHTARWSKVGTTIHVSGLVAINPTLADTYTKFELALPEAQDLTSVSDLTGVSVFASNRFFKITASTSNDTAVFEGYPGSDLTVQIKYSYMYTIG